MSQSILRRLGANFLCQYPPFLARISDQRFARKLRSPNSLKKASCKLRVPDWFHFGTSVFTVPAREGYTESALSRQHVDFGQNLSRLASIR